MNNPAIRLVCFDLGGVIVRTCDSWASACVRAGVPYRPEVEELRRQDRVRALDVEWQLGLIDPDGYFRGLSDRLERLYSVEELERIHQAWLLGEFPGTDALVRKLNGLGTVTTACLSNTNAHHWQMMGADSASSPFQAFHNLRDRQASHLLHLVKPGPEIYREFERRTGAAGGEILFFDDLTENVEAARRAGWQAEEIRPGEEPSAQIGRLLEAHGIL